MLYSIKNTLQHNSATSTKNIVLRFRLHCQLIFICLFVTSCSLIKIENDQKPLAVRELNTRLLTQNFARTAMDRIEYAADSISNLNQKNQSVQLNTIKWKIQTSEEIGKISFQNEPKVALIDTWSYFLEVKKSLEMPEFETTFGPNKSIALEAIDQNIADIENIALNVLPQEEYKLLKGLVKQHSENMPLHMQKEFKHQSIRSSYLKFKNIPDSTAVRTVGTLSEVVADASNRLGYYSDISGKRFNWKTEMLLKKQGLDSISFEAKLNEFDKQFNRLLEVAENSPETIEGAITEFKKNISPLFRSLNYEIGTAMQSLSKDAKSIDVMLQRERIALDSIILRERIALSTKADILVETGIESVFEGLIATLRKLIVYFILLFLTVLGLPFYLGYLTGKRKSK